MGALLGPAVLVAVLAGATAAHAGPNAPGSDSVNAFYGNYQTAIPILVPEFRSITPQLSVSYSSNGGNDFVGVGWALSGVPSIERASPGNGAPRYDGTDVYFLEGQELYPCYFGGPSPGCQAGGTHAPKTEDYQRYYYDSFYDTWTVTTKDGTQLLFYPVQYSSGGAFRWGLTTVTDVHGNSVYYLWECDAGGECYPDRISYNGSQVQIKLYREPRPDYSSYANGRSIVTMQSRLRSIDISVNGQRLRIYQFRYGTGFTGRSMPDLIQLYGRDAVVDTAGNVTGGSALPGSTFFYRYGGGGLVPSQGFDSSNDGDGLSNNNNLFASGSDQKGYGTFDTNNEESINLVDVTGDGRADACILMDYGIHCYPSVGTGFRYDPAWETRLFTASGSANSEDNWRTLQYPDVNGDGKADACFRRDTGLQCCPSTGSGFSCTSGYDTTLWANSTNFDSDNWRTLQFPDINGDGKADACVRRDSGVQCYLSTGTGFSSSAGYTTSLLANATNFDANNWSTLRFPDVDGDGKADLAIRMDNGVKFWRSTGVGFVSVPASVQFFDDGFDQRGLGSFNDNNWGTVNFVDVNGDGKADACGRMDYGIHCYLSTGQTFVYSTSWDSGATGQKLFSSDSYQRGYGSYDDDNWQSIRFADLNGDGLAEVCGRMDYGLVCYLNTGNGWASLFGYDTSFGRNGSDQKGYGTWDGDNDNTLQLADITGEGKASPCFRHDYGLVCWRSDGRAELLERLMNGYGGDTYVEYKPSASWANTNNPPAVQTVSAIRVDDGRGQVSRTEFEYAGGLYDFMERRFLGFRYVKRRLPCISGELSCPYEETWFRQEYGSISKVERQDSLDGAGRLLTSTHHQYTTSGANVPYTSLETGSWSYVYDGFGNTCGSWPCPYGKRSYTSRVHDAYGNVVQETHWGDYDVAGDERTAGFTFRPNTSRYIVSRPAISESWQGTDATGARLGQTLYYYDGASTWDAVPSKGAVTTTLQWHDLTGGYVTSQTEYDSFGNVVAQVGALGARTTYGIDPGFGQFITSTTMPNGRTATTEWDPVCGKRTRTTDTLGQVVYLQYDALCRLTRKDLPGGAWEVHRYPNLGNPWDQYNEVESNSLDGSSTAWARQYFDGLNRIRRKETNGPTAGVSIRVDSDFNARGQLERESAPYFSNASPAWTLTRYDGFDRPVQVITPDNLSSTVTYGLGRRTSVDAEGHSTLEVLDGFGRVVERQELSEQGWLATRYQFDARGNITRITDTAGNVWTFGYDSLNRKLWSQDPDLGSWTYEYDASGRELAHTDAKGQRTTFTYDASDRVKTKTTRAGTAQAQTVTWVYDEERAGYSNFGQLTSLVDPAGTWTFDYNANGQQVRTSRTQDGVTYTTQRGYNLNGQLLWVQYPDGDSVGSAANPLRYDANGRLKVIPGIVSDATYTPGGQLLTQTNANGSLTTFAYDPSRHWRTRIRTTRGTSLLQDLTYTRNGIGMVRRVTSPFPDESWEYTYDKRNQLTAVTALQNQAGNWVTVSSPYNQAFTYDAVGNLTYNSHVGSYSYPAAGSARPHAVQVAGANFYSYDANGNLQSGGGRSYVYNADNQPVSISGVLFTYDGFGHRVKKVASGITTLTLGSDYELSGGVSTKYVTLGGRLVAKRVGTTTFWLHTDDLGSVQSITDAAGNQVQRLNYKAYGERLSTATSHTEARSFTGQRQDETGLIYLGARYYDPVLGRFISPDPTSPTDRALGLNRFAFAGNNPINNVDVDGLGFFDDVGRFLKKVWNGFVSVVRWVAKIPVIGSAIATPLFAINMADALLSGDFEFAARMLGAAVIQTLADSLIAMTGGMAVGLVIAANAAIGFAQGAATAAIYGKGRSGILWGAGATAFISAVAVLPLLIPDAPEAVNTGTSGAIGHRARAFDNGDGTTTIRIRGVTRHHRPMGFRGYLQDLKDITANRVGRLSYTGAAVKEFIQRRGLGPGNVIIEGHSLGSWDALSLGRRGLANTVTAYATPGIALNVVNGHIPGVKNLKIHTAFNDPVTLGVFISPVSAVAHTLGAGEWRWLPGLVNHDEPAWGFWWGTP